MHAPIILSVTLKLIRMPSNEDPTKINLIDARIGAETHINGSFWNSATSSHSLAHRVLQDEDKQKAH